MIASSPRDSPATVLRKGYSQSLTVKRTKRGCGLLAGTSYLLVAGTPAGGTCNFFARCATCTIKSSAQFTLRSTCNFFLLLY